MGRMFAQPRPRRALTRLLLWTGFVNGLLASLISLPAILGQGLPRDPLAQLYLLLHQIGHFQFLALLPALLLVFLALLVPRKRLVLPLAVLLFSEFLLLVLTDYAVFRLYRFHLNGMVWNLLTGGAMREIFVFDSANLLSVAGLAFSILLLESGLLWWLSRHRPVPLGGWKVAALVLLIQIGGQGLHAWADAVWRPQLLAQLRFAPMPMALTAKSSLRKLGLEIDDSPPRELQAATSGRFRYPLAELSCRPEKPPMNLLFILIDGLRFDMLNPEVMPNWSALAAHSQVFEQHVSSGNATRFGVFGLFSGLYGHYWFDALENRRGSVLIEELKRQGYDFGFFANARLSSPEFDKTIFAPVAGLIPDKTPGDSVIEREYRIVHQAREFLTRPRQQPFFGLVFFDAPHAYVSPAEDQRFQPSLESVNYLQLDNDSDPLPFLNRYRNAVHFDDRLSGELFTLLSEQGLMENTVIVLTGDHGQEANETRTNSWGHNSNFSRWQIQTPLIVYWPGKPPRRYRRLTSHVDVVPTLMRDLLGCDNPVGDYSNGLPLFGERRHDFLLEKNWTDQGILFDERVRLFPKFGLRQMRDFRDWKPLPEQPRDSRHDADALRAINRFYR
jgi:membrane-anchored protein YejM (alkaline phosphatase superfamily)